VPLTDAAVVHDRREREGAGMRQRVIHSLRWRGERQVLVGDLLHSGEDGLQVGRQTLDRGVSPSAVEQPREVSAPVVSEEEIAKLQAIAEIHRRPPGFPRSQHAGACRASRQADPPRCPGVDRLARSRSLCGRSALAVWLVLGGRAADPRWPFDRCNIGLRIGRPPDGARPAYGAASTTCLSWTKSTYFATQPVTR
jgi:hypothetical protein